MITEGVRFPCETANVSLGTRLEASPSIAADPTSRLHLRVSKCVCAIRDVVLSQSRVCSVSFHQNLGHKVSYLDIAYNFSTTVAPIRMAKQVRKVTA